jgi:hypothetical protein
MLFEILLNDEANIPSREALRWAIFRIASDHQSLERYAIRKSPHVRGAGKLNVGALTKAEIEQFNRGFPTFRTPGAVAM